ncbi:MAG: hypothetical protein CEE43_14365 [Promethearchaeota archaeon Loki_b32]|nr:MAG: hypothetical protein CEE43_14365 [Candidatus Lokiarchaeota archaeon Loki_b32]
MGKVIRNLWILAESGVTLFNRTIDPTVGPQVFGGLMSALNTFAETLSEGGMSHFELSSVRFTIVKNNNFLFVANSSNEIKSKKILNELKNISKNFFIVYPEETIKNYYKNIRVFADFTNHISDSLEEII